jgi:hypothetical protein
MNEELQQLLKNLHLKKTLEILEDQLARADKEGLPIQKLLVRLLRAEWEARQQSALAWRINTTASFPLRCRRGGEKWIISIG